MSHPVPHRLQITAKAIYIIAVAIICVALTVLVAPAARAQQTTFTLQASPPPLGNTVLVTYGGVTKNVYAGPYFATVGTANNVRVLCTDYSHSIKFNQGYATYAGKNVTDAAGGLTTIGTAQYYNGGLASAITPGDYGAKNLGALSAAARASQVAWLSDTFLLSSSFNGSSGSTNLNANMTAISLAVWDIVQDGGNGIGLGYFTAAAGYNSLVNHYLALAAANSNYKSSTVKWIQPPNPGNANHAQGFLMVQPVPEPSEIVIGAFMFGGIALGLIRGRLRQRKRKTDAPVS